LTARRIEVRLERLASGGDAVGRDESGRVTFVARAAPQELAEVEVFEEHKSFARARLLKVLEPSPDRVEAPCREFVRAACGGCQWQHVSLSAQRRAKQEIVESALRRLSDRGLKLLPMEEPVDGFGWRRRARLAWIAIGSKRLLGFRPPRSRRVTDLRECQQLEPGFLEVLLQVKRAILPGLRGRGELSALWNGEQVHLDLHGDVRRDVLEEVAGIPGVAGFRRGKHSLGERGVALPEGGFASARDFVQASSSGNAALRAIVASWAGDLTGASVLELYAGTGNLTSALRGAERIVAIEEIAPARPPEACDYRVGRAEKLVPELREEFELVLLDPPRAGAREVVGPLAELGPRRILYVSCDAATLARDALQLCEAGYRPVRAQPLDLMPQTSHVEVILELIQEESRA
jgi:23S rRNA (uracil1939-C5)-methyltransferase